MQTNKIFLFVFFTTVLTFSEKHVLFAQNSNDTFVVVLDAGHGGKDPGRPTKYGYKEKDIALSIVLQVGKELEKYKNVEVIYTRKKDVFVELRGRAKIANDADADLFVSVHCNAHNSQAYGSETYVLGLHVNEQNFEVAKKENEVIFLEADHEKHYEGFDPNSPESIIGLILSQEEYLDHSILLARHVQDNFAKKLKRKDRGVKQAGFWVLHNTYMPSVLVETGFITNKKEGDYLNSKRGQKEISASIVDAIINYKRSLDQNIGVEVFKKKENVLSEDTPEQIYSNIVFKVQIAASSRKLEPKAYNFKGLSEISREKEGSLYRYFYGYTSNYNKIKQFHKKAVAKGYKTSYIVAYKNGKKINLGEALKTSLN